MSLYSDYIESLGPYAYWRLGENSGTQAVDETVNAYHGTYVNSPTLGVTGLIAGDLDTAVDFTGTSKRVSLPIHPEHSQGAVVCSVKVSSLTTTNYIYTKSRTTEDEFVGVGITDAGAVFIQYFMKAPDVHDFYYTDDGVINAGSTYNVVIQSAGSEYEIYVDGVLKTGQLLLGANSGNWFGDSQISASSAYIGALDRLSGITAVDFNCVLDELSLFSVVLTQPQITEIYIRSSTSSFGFGVFDAMTGNASGQIAIAPVTASASGVFSAIIGSASGQVQDLSVLGVGAGVFSSVFASASGQVQEFNVTATGFGSFVAVVGSVSAYSSDGTNIEAFFLAVDGVAIQNSQIHGLIDISRAENEAATMNVTIISQSGVQDIDSFLGKAILLNVDGVRVFTGIVDTPEIDIIEQKITLICSDNRKNKLNTDLAAAISGIGFYSEAIFSKQDNVIDELEQRLTTIPSVVDIGPNGVYSVTDINPKDTADFSLSGSDIYRDSVEVSITSAQRITNRIELSFDYRYTRLRHRERGFKIEDLSFCDILDLGPLGSFTLKSSFMNYVGMMAWEINEATIVWEDMPNSTASTAPPCTVDVAYVHQPRFATSIRYDAAKRFAQTITEKFVITVRAPQSIAQYGVTNWSQSNGLDVEFDVAAWESPDGYQSPIGGIDDINDYYIDETGPGSEFNNAILTAINIASTKIIRSHRDTQVKFESTLRTDFDLTKTIEISSGLIDAKGKITSLRHIFDVTNDIGKTITEISLSTAQGAQVPTVIAVPVRPEVAVLSDPWEDPQVMLIADGNIVTPEIDDTSRNEQIVNQIVTYNVEIQNDTFQVIF